MRPISSWLKWGVWSVSSWCSNSSLSWSSFHCRQWRNQVGAERPPGQQFWGNFKMKIISVVYNLQRFLANIPWTIFSCWKCMSLLYFNFPKINDSIKSDSKFPYNVNKSNFLLLLGKSFATSIFTLGKYNICLWDSLNYISTYNLNLNFPTK